jgi:protein gp37
MNKQGKNGIGWCDWTWSPVTGCLHGCLYCYARKISTRFTGNFLPTLHIDRMDEPQKLKKQQKIFVCSMADLFGDWVSIDWIRQVFEACAKAPKHHYIFLTKNAERIKSDAELERLFYQLVSSSVCSGGSISIGITATNQYDYTFALRVLASQSFLLNTFISIEPIHSYIDVVRSGFDNLSWVIVGIETGNRKGKIVAPDEWITDIIMRCAKYKKPLFIKEPLSEKHDLFNIKEFPEILT